MPDIDDTLSAAPSQPRHAGLPFHQLYDDEMLDTSQVGSLGLFGTAPTLEQNRSTGRPGPAWIKVGGRVWYRVSSLRAYLAEQELLSRAEAERRRKRFERGGRRRNKAA